MLADSTAGRCGSPAPTTITRQPGLADLVAGRAQRGDVVGAEVLHLVDEDRRCPCPTSAASPPTSVSSSTRSISMSPESARPRDRGHVDAGAPAAPAACASGAGVALGEGPDHAQHVVDAVRLRWPSSRTAWCRALGSGRRSHWSGRASSLPVPQRLRTAGRAQRVEQHGLADPAQPGQHQRCARGGPAATRSRTTSNGAQLLVAAGELGRALAGAGGVGVPDRVHDRTLSAISSRSLDCRSDVSRRSGSASPGRRRRGSSVDAAPGRCAGDVVRPGRGRRAACRSGPAPRRPEPEGARADVVAPQRQHDQVGLGVPGDPQRAVSPRASRKTSPASGAAA